MYCFISYLPIIYFCSLGHARFKCCGCVLVQRQGIGRGLFWHRMELVDSIKWNIVIPRHSRQKGSFRSKNEQRRTFSSHFSQTSWMYSEMERIWRQRTNNQLLLYLGVEFIISIPVSFLVVLVYLIARHQCAKFGTHHIDDTTSWHNQEYFLDVSCRFNKGIDNLLI